jgi:hypothetical protein
MWAEPVMVCFHGMGGDKSLVDVLKTYPGIDKPLVSFDMCGFYSRQDLDPAIQTLKECVKRYDAIDLYGFSAGGGAILRTLAYLREEGETDLLRAIEKGRIILECPTKPIGEISKLQGLKLNFIVHFQNPDEAVGNRDDNAFIARLKEIGPVRVFTGNDGGHFAYHGSFWGQF